MSDVANALHHALADTYVTYLMAHNYHWNVAGPHFYAYHQLLEEQYQNLFEAIDEIAERLRALGLIVFPEVTDFLRMAHVKPGIVPGSSAAGANDMLNALARAHEATILQLQRTKRAAEAEGDDETTDLAVARITEHQKMLWMLKASLAK